MLPGVSGRPTTAPALSTDNDADTVHLGKLESDDLTLKRLRVIEHAGDDLA